MKRALNKRVLILSLVLLVLIINLTLINAAPKDDVTNFFSSIFSDSGMSWYQAWSLYSAQGLLWILVVLIIWAISDAIPFLENANPLVRLAISAVIGALSVLYLTPEEVFTALMGYEALGVSLTTILPFVILLVITIKWNVKYPQYSFFSSIAWIAYLVAYLIKYSLSLFAWWTGGVDPNGIGTFGLFFIGITGIISLLMIFLGRVIAGWWFKQRIKGFIDQAALHTEAEIAGHIAQLRAYSAANPGMAADYEEAIKQLSKALAKVHISAHP